MRHLAALAIPSALFLLCACPASAQDLSPELQRMDQFIGTWNYDGMDGTAICQRLADNIVRCNSDWTNADGDPVEAVFIWVHDPLTERYMTYRFYSSGYWDSGTGWFEDGTWVAIYDAQNGNKVKSTSTITADSWTYEWYRSVRGGPWEQTSEGSATRAR